MAQIKFKFQASKTEAIINTPDTELKDIFLQGLELIRYDASILERIEQDLDKAAKKKKAMRLADMKWYMNRNGVLPGFKLLGDEMDIPPDSLNLLDGRPRSLDPEAVFLLLMCRAYLGSITSKRAYDRLKDSILIQTYLDSRNMRLPSPNTLLDYINAISNETREYIFKVQIQWIVKMDIDSMDHIAVDSFSVSGNTEWPTDSRILFNLLRRAWHIGQILVTKFGLPGFSDTCIPRWLRELKALEFRIANTGGKPKSGKKLKKLYRQFLNRVNKTLLRMLRSCVAYLPIWEKLDNFPPSRRMLVRSAIDRLIQDLDTVIYVYTYTGDRIFHGIHLPAPEKVLSLSDESVSFIKKGGREAVVGYKPQVIRSGEGFITAFELQQGNPADSSRTISLLRTHCENVASVPYSVSLDDGYSGVRNREELKGMGIKIVSMGGSKGKKITPEAEWDSPEYQEARNARSAVESIIYVLRHKFHLTVFSRRGLERVTAEFLEKIIAHNFWRVSYLKRKQKIRLVA